MKMKTSRTEATMDQWRALYEIATLVGEMRPWETFADTELIVLGFSKTEQIYVSIMGMGGMVYGLSCYKGADGLDDFVKNMYAGQMGIPLDYSMLSMNCLTCYWGDRQDVSDEQRSIIRQLGYKYRGKNRWLYFESFQDGYLPYRFNAQEVQDMTRYLSGLKDAVDYCRANEPKVDYDAMEAFEYAYSQKSGSWAGRAVRLPLDRVNLPIMPIKDELLARDLRRQKKTRAVLETDMFFLNAAIRDQEFERPANLRLCILADHQNGYLLDQRSVNPLEDYVPVLTEMLADYVIKKGRPDKLLVRNPLIASLVDDICDICGIELVMGEEMPFMDEAIEYIREMKIR